MQLQIEHLCSHSIAQSCVICSQLFQPNLARVVLYIDDEAQGDLCPSCLTQGASYIRTQAQTMPAFDRSSSRAAAPAHYNPHS